jgi:SAM-dependent methyltransferase
MSDLAYVGGELDIFSRAQNWKRYWSACVRPFLFGEVLEVGAGIGANTPLLVQNLGRSWTCLEPDAELGRRAAVALSGHPKTSDCRVIVGTTQTFKENLQFDALLYIDVLEHIEDDKDELERASRLLRRGGSLVVLSPAHQWLYTAFDQSIGHFRRYTRSSLVSCSPTGCSLRKLWYLDSCGMLASLGNRLMLHQSMPNIRQILFWDRFLVPPSTVVDRLLLHRFGKSILAVWTKDQ